MISSNLVDGTEFLFDVRTCERQEQARMEKIKWIANDEQIRKIYPNYLRYRNHDVNDVVLN